jgi:GST-like protein
LNECGLPYRLRAVNLGKRDQFSDRFTRISPNNKMPALVDHDGPGGAPISVFESGAILMYLGRKTGQFYPADPRGRVQVEEWLMWQMGGLGPMAGQVNHFRHAAPEQIPYAIERYTTEVARLYSVMDRRLKDHEFLAGAYSIADIACIGWAKYWERQAQDLSQFPHLKRWFDAVMARPAVQRGYDAAVDRASSFLTEPEPDL